MGLARDVAGRLEKVAGPDSRGWWRACCPFHEDGDPSFGFTAEGFCCQGCGRTGHIGQLAEHLGVKEVGRALWTQEDADRALALRGLRPETVRKFGITADLERQAWKMPLRDGCRMKAFDPRGGRKVWWDPRKPKNPFADLYGWGSVKDSDWILLVEGELDALVGLQAGLPAVSFTGGATSVPSGGLKILAAAGKPVTVLYDLDDPGQIGAAKVAKALRAQGLDVTVLRYIDLPPGGDLTNLYLKLGSDDTALWSAIEELPVVTEEETTQPARTLSLRSLRDLLEEPGALDPPESVAERLAYVGYTTLLASREKVGKSTLASGAAAAVSAGSDWLGTLAKAGQVLYLTLDEGVKDTARRLVAFGADVDAVHLLDRLVDPTDPLSELGQAIEEVGPALVVVDTLAEFARGLKLDSGSAAGWTDLVGGLARAARDHEVAVVVLHHSKKDGSGYRDSTAIGASVDLILEMKDGVTEDTRRIEARGRIPVSGCVLRLSGDPHDVEGDAAWSIADGEIGLSVRIEDFVGRNPGCSTRAVREGVTGRNEEIAVELNRLVNGGRLVDGGEGSERRYSVASSGSQGADSRPPGTTSGTTPGSDGNPQGTAMEPPRNRSGNRGRFPVPTPGGEAGTTPSIEALEL